MESDLGRLTSQLEGRFRIQREIGAGGMARVFLAHDVRHEREVALKVLRPELAGVIATERFIREVGIAGALAHPGIVPVLDSGSIDVDGTTLPYYVMPFVRGESLRDRLSRVRQLPLEEAIRIARDVGEALDFAHAAGIIHRDVKPANILLAGDRAMLADFGIARAVVGAVSQREHLTSTGVAVGTPAYMSPEQAAGDDAIDGRADLYALAVTLYEMLAGDLPFSGVTPQAILARQLSGDVHRLATIRPIAVTESMDLALRRALSPAPADRFLSAREFLREFERGVSGSGHAAPASRGQRLIARVGPIAAGAAAVALTAFALRGFLARDATRGDRRLGIGVMPFRSMSGAELWSETIPDLLSTFIDGTPGLRVADPWAMWRSLRTSSSAPARSPDPPEADRLARHAGVKHYVMGSITRSGSRLELTLRIYGVGHPEPVAAFSVAGSVDSTAQLAQRSAVGVLTRVWKGTDSPAVPQLESILTQSPDALKAYLAAREAMRRGLPDSADASITRALGFDSTFALALVEAISIRSWVQFLRGQPFSGMYELARRANARRDSLTERQRLRLDAMVASVETNGATAADRWQRLLERDSTDVEAIDGLSYITLVYGWQFGATHADMIRRTERALQLDSNDATMLFRRAQLSLSTFDPVDAQRQLTRLQALSHDAPMLRAAQRALQAVVATDSQFGAMLDSLADAPTFEWTSVHRNLRTVRPDRALLVCVRSLQRSAPGPSRELARSGYVALLVAAGRFSAVDSLWRAGALDANGTPTRYAQLIVYTALLGAGDSALTARAVRTLTDYVPVDSALAYFDTRPVWSIAHTVGAWNAQFGDTLVAQRWLVLVPQFRAEGSPPEWREAIAADIEGRLATRRGDTAGARASVEQAYRHWSVHTGNVSAADIEPALRFRLAESLLERGLADSAARIFQSFVPPSSWVGSYVPLAHRMIARAAERAGNPSVAARHYDQALELWGLGDAGVAPWRREMEDGLRRSAVSPLFRYGGR